jgi:predicted nucleotidyltransferase
MENKTTMPDALPSEVRTWLAEVSTTLIDSLGSDLRSLIVFGSAAEGRMRASSDVNLLVLLRRFDAAKIDGARGLLHTAAAAIELHPMFLLEKEIQLAAESFAEKFDDMANRHYVIFGVDPFEALSIPRPVLVRRVRQILLNQTLRLRANYAAGPTNEEGLAGIIADSAAPLRRSANAIVEFRGGSADSPKAALQAVATELGDHWIENLGQISRARDSLRLEPGTALGVILRLAALAEAMQGLVAELAES